MTKKNTFTKSIKRNRVSPSCTNSFNHTRKNEQEFSLSKAVKKIAHEINKILDHGYSREDVAAILGNGNIETIKQAQSNNSISNIAVELLPKSESFTEKPHFHVMASYNDSNRVPDHEARWNSR
jgi:transposase-like protein